MFRIVYDNGMVLVGLLDLPAARRRRRRRITVIIFQTVNISGAQEPNIIDIQHT